MNKDLFRTANLIFLLANNINRSNQAHSMMRRSFLKWAFNPRNNTGDIVIELIFILDCINKNPESRQEMEEMTGDALK